MNAPAITVPGNMYQTITHQTRFRATDRTVATQAGVMTHGR